MTLKLNQTGLFRGTHTALITPFLDDLSIDESSYIKLIEVQIAAQIEGIIIAGTTGESSTLSHEEHLHLIKIAVKISSKKILVIAGTGSNSTQEAIELTQAAEKLGADASLQVVPYYNIPSSKGLYNHFKKIADSVSIPIILYNVPRRTGLDLPIDVIAHLAHSTNNIVALKEASNNIHRMNQLKSVHLPQNFAILAGDDSLTLPFMVLGAIGVVSVATNIIPTGVKQMVDYALMNNWSQAQQLHELYLPLLNNLTLETNPIPIKKATSLLGLCSSHMRSPLTELQEQHTKELIQTLRLLKLME